MEEQVVAFLDRPQDLRNSELGRHELLQTLVRFVESGYLLTLLVGLIKSPCQFVELYLTEGQYLQFSLVWLF